MQLRRSFDAIAALWMVVVSVGAFAQQQPVRINLTGEDEYVLRIMTVTKKSGEIVPNLLTVEAFDPESKQFTFSRAGAGRLQLAAKDIGTITFQRERQRQRPSEQSPPWHVEVTSGQELAIGIPIKDIKFESGQLVVSDPRALAPSKESQMEVNRIEYGPTKREFAVILQPMQYQKVIEGGGGDVTGRGKGLQ